MGLHHGGKVPSKASCSFITYYNPQRCDYTTTLYTGNGSIQDNGLH